MIASKNYIQYRNAVKMVRGDRGLSSVTFSLSHEDSYYPVLDFIKINFDSREYLIADDKCISYNRFMVLSYNGALINYLKLYLKGEKIEYN